MTKEQTRQLGIEFERRLQTLNPAFILNKPDTNTIYSYLNEAQHQLVTAILQQEDSVNSNTKASIRMQELLRTLVTHKLLETVDYDAKHDKDSNWDNFSQYGDWYCCIFNLSDIEDYLSYIRSTSRVEHTYKNPNEDQVERMLLPNKFVKQSDIEKILVRPHNKYGVLRSPLATIEQYEGKSILKVIYDSYTDVIGADITYYRLPKRFSVGNNSVDCELPFDLFDVLVNTAVTTYLSYVQPQQKQPKQEQQQQQQKQQEDNQ